MLGAALCSGEYIQTTCRNSLPSPSPSPTHTPPLPPPVHLTHTQVSFFLPKYESTQLRDDWSVRKVPLSLCGRGRYGTVWKRRTIRGEHAGTHWAMRVQSKVLHTSTLLNTFWPQATSSHTSKDTSVISMIKSAQPSVCHHYNEVMLNRMRIWMS